jgi:gamma-glutamyl:cysteine ligase YbdK (ATP-grasp superfamily)
MFRTSEKIVRTYTKKHSTPDVPEDVVREAIKAVTGICHHVRQLCFME